jgi:cytochrome bd-type quinol oxidase subunit 1
MENLSPPPTGTKRIAAVGGGFLLLAAGIALLVLPGPGIPLVLAGLALLSTVFPWAKRALGWCLEQVQRLRSRLKAG